MIRNIKLFVNNKDQSIQLAKVVREKFSNNGFKVLDNIDDKGKYDLAVAIGGDGTFLSMVKDNKFNSNVYYVGINTGHLGFLQEVKINEIDKLIQELKEKKYKIEKVGIQKTKIYQENSIKQFYSLNEITVRDSRLKTLQANIYIDNDFLENYRGDGIMVATSIGSTAYNLSYGGSIVFPTFSTLQITSMAPINSKVYQSLANSIIVPSKKEIMIEPKNEDIIVSVDGENYYYNDISKIETTIKNKKIKCLRFSHYNFPQKINEKLLLQ